MYVLFPALGMKAQQLALMDREASCGVGQGKSSRRVEERTRLDDGQMTHLICVRLQYLLFDFFFWGGVGFPVLFLPFPVLYCGVGFPVLFLPFPVLYLHIFWTFPVQFPQGKSTKHQKTSDDSKTGWAPIRCVVWRSLNAPSCARTGMTEDDPEVTEKYSGTTRA